MRKEDRVEMFIVVYVISLLLLACDEDTNPWKDDERSE